MFTRTTVLVALSTLFSTAALASDNRSCSSSHTRPADAEFVSYEQGHSHHHGDHSKVKVEVSNHTGRTLAIVADGRLVAQIGAWDRKKVKLDARDRRVEAWVDGRLVEVLSGPTVSWNKRSWVVEGPRMGSLEIRNAENVSVRVYVDGRFVGVVGARGVVDFDVDIGRHRVVAVRTTGRHGRGIEVLDAVVSVDPYREAELVAGSSRQSSPPRHRRPA